MFRDTDILPGNTYTHVNNGCIIVQCSIFCPNLVLTATPSRMLLAQITVLLQLP